MWFLVQNDYRKSKFELFVVGYLIELAIIELFKNAYELWAEDPTVVFYWFVKSIGPQFISIFVILIIILFNQENECVNKGY